MDGRWLTVALFLLLPAALIGLTCFEFHSNPVAIVGLIGVMIVGAFYLLSYSESFA